jgi:hypothetical protein
MKFRTKPVVEVVDAVQVSESWFHPQLRADIPPGVTVNMDTVTVTLDGDLFAEAFIRIGDWIVTNSDGTRYAVDREDFYTQFEPCASHEITGNVSIRA